MSKKDYVKLAKLLLEFRNKQVDKFVHQTHIDGFNADLDRDLIVPLAHVLRKENSAFDYTRFLAACGVEAV